MNNVADEMSVLGLALQDPTQVDLITSLLEDDDFSDVKNKSIFSAISTLAKSDFDEIKPSMVVNYLIQNDKLSSIGGEAYIARLMNSAALKSNVEAHIRRLNEASRMRRVFNTLNDSVKKFKSANIDESLIEKVEADIIAATRNESVGDFADANSVVDEAIELKRYKKENQQSTGVLTGWDNLDKKLGGLQKGDLVIVAARPSVGKTAFSMNLALNVAHNANVAVFSLEMSKVQIINRLASNLSAVDSYKIKDPNKLTPEEEQSLEIGYQKLRDLSFFIDDSSNITLSDLIWKAKKLHKKNPLGLIVVDYLQLLKIGKVADTQNRQAEVSAISRALKQLARELEIPVIALSQLSRRIEQGGEKRLPMLSDIRESGAIEQDADIIMFLSRDEQKDENGVSRSTSGQTIIDVTIAKHRNGAIGGAKLVFQSNITAFFEKGGE